MLIITFFYLRDGRRLWVWIVRQVPSVNVPIWSGSATGRGTSCANVRGQAVIATFDAVAIGLGVWLIGLPLVLPIAVLTFFLAFIPQVGAVVSGGIAVLIGIASGGFVDGALVLLLTLAVNQGEGLLSPFVVGHNVNLHPLVVLLSAIAGIAIAGVLGGVLAVPTVAIAWCVYRELSRVVSSTTRRSRHDQAAPVIELNIFSDLAGWLGEVWDQIKSVDIQYLILGCALQTVQTLLNGLAWRNILGESYGQENVPTRPMLSAYAGGIGLNSFLRRRRARSPTSGCSAPSSPDRPSPASWPAGWCAEPVLRRRRNVELPLPVRDAAGLG